MVKLKNVSFCKESNKKQNSNITFVEPEGMIDVELFEVVSDDPAISEKVNKTAQSYESKCWKVLLLIVIGFAVITCVLMAFYITNDILINWPGFSNNSFNLTNYENNNLNTTVEKPGDHNSLKVIKPNCRHKRDITNENNEIIKNETIMESKNHKGNSSTIDKAWLITNSFNDTIPFLNTGEIFMNNDSSESSVNTIHTNVIKSKLPNETDFTANTKLDNEREKNVTTETYKENLFRDLNAANTVPYESTVKPEGSKTMFDEVNAENEVQSEESGMSESEESKEDNPNVYDAELTKTSKHDIDSTISSLSTTSDVTFHTTNKVVDAAVTTRPTTFGDTSSVKVQTSDYEPIKLESTTTVYPSSKISSTLPTTDFKLGVIEDSSSSIKYTTEYTLPTISSFDSTNLSSDDNSTLSTHRYYSDSFTTNASEEAISLSTETLILHEKKNITDTATNSELKKYDNTEIKSTLSSGEYSNLTENEEMTSNFPLFSPTTVSGNETLKESNFTEVLTSLETSTADMGSYTKGFSSDVDFNFFSTASEAIHTSKTESFDKNNESSTPIPASFYTSSTTSLVTGYDGYGAGSESVSTTDAKTTSNFPTEHRKDDWSDDYFSSSPTSTITTTTIQATTESYSVYEEFTSTQKPIITENTDSSLVTVSDKLKNNSVSQTGDEKKKFNFDQNYEHTEIIINSSTTKSSISQDNELDSIYTNLSSESTTILESSSNPSSTEIVYPSTDTSTNDKQEIITKPTTDTITNRKRLYLFNEFMETIGDLLRSAAFSDIDNFKNDNSQRISNSIVSSKNENENIVNFETVNLSNSSNLTTTNPEEFETASDQNEFQLSTTLNLNDYDLSTMLPNQSRLDRKAQGNQLDSNAKTNDHTNTTDPLKFRWSNQDLNYESTKTATKVVSQEFETTESSTTLNVNDYDLPTTIPHQSRLDGIAQGDQLDDNTKTINQTNTTGPLKFRWSAQDLNFDNVKTSAKEFSAVNQHSPRSQQSMVPCSPYVSSMGYPIIQQTNASPYVYSTNQALSYTNMMPVPVPRIQTTNSQFPYSSTNISPSGYVLYNMNGQNIVAPSPGGQYYICNPINNIVGSIRNDEKDASSETEEPKFIEDSDFESSFAAGVLQNKTRSSRDCPSTERSCEDDSKCINLRQFCDGDVHCRDASDETFCPCKFRIGKARLCDGYFDCPNGEDEQKCFGCAADMFSCDDWSARDREATCIPIEQRCDGIPQCPTGNDERDCSALMERFSERQHFMVSATVGFLYRNFKGRWYPVCRNPELWANEVCKSEAGPSTVSPLTHLVPVETSYRGPYASASSKEAVKIVHTCESEAAIFVECPPLVCGMRKKIRNPYRTHEVDTSAEQILSLFHQEEETHDKNTTDSILGDGRVVGGNPSQPEAWPWVILMYRNGVFHCGGVLINDLWIITAAHCVDKFWHYYYEIQAGILRRYSYAPMVQRRIVSHVIAHQLYDRSKLKNDLALMRMSKPFIFNQYIRPICLPSELTAGKNFMWGPEPGTLCTAVGWGATVEHGTDPDHLREVEVPVLRHCKHREDKEGQEICAGFMEGGKDACQGDSGGPFMCRNPNAPNQWYLSGIVSHGEGCARPNEPGVYTRVSLFLEWIFENTRAEVLPQRKPLLNCPGYACRKTKKCIANKRRCNRVVDCLLGDDELDCDKTTFNDIFKHAMRRMFVTFQRENSQNNDTIGASIIEAHDIHTSENKKAKAKVTTETYENQTKTFVCKKMSQPIEYSQRCDGNVDCEDASDEENCLCAIYLRNTHPEAVCDGISDCLDSSDEDDCGTCKTTEFYCRLSKQCISKEKRCNNIQDCDLGEDESDCFILTNGKTVILDDDSRPYLNNTGFVSFLYGDKWRVVCSNWSDNVASLAADVCSYLGFRDYRSFYKVPLNHNDLQISYHGKVVSTSNQSASTDKCMALFLKCSETLDITNQFANGSTPPLTPWNAEIYINGDFKCTGAILNEEWVISSLDCFGYDFKLYENYVAVLLGKRKGYLNIVSPYEQIFKVVETAKVFDSNIILLRVNGSIAFSRYIRPIQLTVRDYSISEKETCIATGRNFKNHTVSIHLQTSTNCSDGSRCFKRIHQTENSCQKDISQPWSGSIVCQSRDGWYPAAVFYDAKGFCGFNSVTAYTSVQYWKTLIAKLMKQAPFVVSTPACAGFRCNLGKCIERDDVCDGMPDCHDSADEDVHYCRELKEDCRTLSNCACLKSELKCQNGKCVPKTAFCNLVNDCGDWSDEPGLCTCGSYLNLTNPEKLCDGIRNCYDRTDEDCQIYQCKSNHFKCERTKRCIAPEMVCDGVPDCPEGEDEEQCMALVSTPGSTIAEVQVRNGGFWHPGCFPKSLTTLELEAICAELGFTGGSALRIYPHNDLARKNTWRPVTDPFVGVVIHRNEKDNLILLIRSGSKSFVTLRTDPKCYRLYLQCL